MKKVKNTLPWTYLIEDLNGKQVSSTFYEKRLTKENKREFRIVKMIKKKGNKLCVKRKQYHNCLNC